MPRTIAIGDIHGCSHELASLLTAIAPQPDDTNIPLLDYVGRGHDSKGVLDLLLDLSGRCRVVPVLGNHDEMMLRSKDCKSAFRDWWKWGASRPSRMDCQGESI